MYRREVLEWLNVQQVELGNVVKVLQSMWRMVNVENNVRQSDLDYIEAVVNNLSLDIARLKRSLPQ